MLELERLLLEGLAHSPADHYRDTGFIAPVSALVDGLNNEAQLNDAGYDFHHNRLKGLLRNRKALEDWTDRHPEIADEAIVAPIVIVGLPRTGTTLMHRTVATDDSLMAPLWYEVRQPAPLEQDFVDHDARIAVAKAEIDAMLAAMPGLAAIHPMDALAPDEEVMLLEHSFMSTVPECYGYLPHYGQWLQEQDQAPAYDCLVDMLRFLQWQKRQRGQRARRWLLKTPHHLHFPDQLFRTFPDAVVVQSHREPREVMPSYASMMCELAAPFTDKLDKAAMADHWVGKWQRGLAATQRYREQRPEAPYLDLTFRESLDQPETMIARLYEFAGLELRPEAVAEMQRWRDFNQRENRPEHHYTAAEFGLDPGQLDQQFLAYREHYLSA